MRLLRNEISNDIATKSSCFITAMEKEGFTRVVDNLQRTIDIRAVSTDRHVQIKKLMETDPRFASIIHQFDPWHVAKNISKQLVKASKNKGKP